MNYSETIRFLYELRMFGAKFGLENTIKLAASAGHPQHQLRFIHVAGTNGKGSTCAMLESMYRVAGWRVGLFTSPHLVSFRERIQVDRKLINEAEIIRLVRELQPALATFAHDHHPTFFEVLAVMALSYFAAQKCDLVIWETGLGGRLDATNIVTPLASVITNIGLDHQQWLGNTVAAIAVEKAGIIKLGVPVLTAAADPAALAVIQQRARECGSFCKAVSQPLTETTCGAPRLGLLGDHQRMNAALAVATVELLQKEIAVPPQAVERGLQSVVWPGRMQLVQRGNGKRILIDGAHNEAGVAALLAGLQNHFPGIVPSLILGVLADKEWRVMGRQLAERAAAIYTVPVASDRAVSAAELADVCRAAQPFATIACRSLQEALERTSQSPFTVITGSLYLVGEALEILGLGPEGPSERGLNEWGGTPGSAKSVP